MPNFLLIFISVILFAITTGHHQESRELSDMDGRIIQRLDSLMRRVNQRGDFNGSILIAKNDMVIYENIFGFADSSKTALKANDKFLIGSIYKEISAVSIMQLRERGLLKLGDKLSTYFPELPDWAEEVTIHNLLQYTSGLPRFNWGQQEEILDNTFLNSLTEITKLEFTPGTGYLYTNYSPFLLAKIVEKVTGMSFPDYVKENILSPNGLTQTAFKNHFPYANREAMAISLDTDYKEDYPPFKIKTPLFLYATTARDLFNWAQKLHGYEIIGEESLKLLAKPAHTTNENVQSSLGNVSFANGRLIEHAHHGSSGNYESLLKRYGKENITIILMTNRKKGNLFDLSGKILQIMNNTI